MGTNFALVNVTRRERVMFLHVAASTAGEIVGNPVAAAITAWYLLQNAGDHVAFVADDGPAWPFPTGSRADLGTYAEVTDRVVGELIAAGIVEDHGLLYVDPDEPDTVFVRDLRAR